jgi:hypothetical protein
MSNMCASAGATDWRACPSFFDHTCHIACYLTCFLQVGAFPHYGGRWSEWNGTYRDTVRQFLKGTEGPWAGNFASALCGSPNIYANTHPAETDW